VFGRTRKRGEQNTKRRWKDKGPEGVPEGESGLLLFTRTSGAEDCVQQSGEENNGGQLTGHDCAEFLGKFSRIVKIKFFN